MRWVWIDKQTPSAYRAQAGVVKAVREAVAEAGLDRRLLELVNIRVSQLNGCAFCLDVHVRDALAAGETSQRLAVLPAWRDAADLFTEQERAALTVAEALTSLPEPRTQRGAYLYARRYLADEQFSAVSWAVLTMNALNRLSIVSHHPVKRR